MLNMLNPFVNMKVGVAIVISIAMLVACGKVPINEPGKPIRTFSENFETNSLNSFDLLLAQDSSFNTSIVDFPVRKGTKALKTILRPTDFIYNGYRTELAIYNSANYQSEAFYGFSFFIDTNYQDESYTLLCQWQDLPDYLRGESWTSTPSLHGSPPPLQLTYINGNIELKGNTNPRSSNQTFLIGNTIKIEKGIWYDFTAHIYWDDTDKGYIEAWLNDDYITPYNGSDYKYYSQNLVNRAGNYFKFGQYHGHIKPKHTNLVYFDEVKIGSTFNSVQP